MRRASRTRKPVAAGIGGADLASQLFGRQPEHRLALLRAAWAAAVGPEVSRRTEVLAIEGRTLRVRVPDARWHKVLHRMRRDLLSRLHSMVGALAPTAIGFQAGQVVAPPELPAPAPAVRVAREAPPLIVEAAQQIADVELRERFTAAAARYLDLQRNEER